MIETEDGEIIVETGMYFLGWGIAYGTLLSLTNSLQVILKCLLSSLT